VADIVRAVDEALDATQCRGRENCKDEACCLTHELWATLNLKMYEYLESVTLSDLVGKHREKTGAGVSSLKDARRSKPRVRGALPASV
jgi:Rrf2 family iron-sulfur cluster assembly transcriptional regulator